MAKRVSVDKWLFGVTLLLVFVGLVMVFSASAVMAKERFGSPYSFLFKQLAWAAAGLVAMVVVMNIDYKQLRRPTVVFTFLGTTSPAADCGLFLPRLAQHASLDQVRRFCPSSRPSWRSRRSSFIWRTSSRPAGSRSPIGSMYCFRRPRRPYCWRC